MLGSECCQFLMRTHAAADDRRRIALRFQENHYAIRVRQQSAMSSWSQRSCDARIRGLLALILICLSKMLCLSLPAASEHLVWNKKFIDNYVPLGVELTATWGCSVKTSCAMGKCIFVFSTWLPDGTGSTLALHDVLHIPALHVNLISVPKMLSVADGKEVFFSGGAKVLQDGVLVSYSPDTGDNNDLYPLLCTTDDMCAQAGIIQEKLSS